jgi:hypothetical protein
MKISLLTDAPKHNLALMKLSAWHKKQGNTVLLNMPLFPSDISYASILFEKNARIFNADTFGGPAFSNSVLPSKIEMMKPDYSLFTHEKRRNRWIGEQVVGIDYSLGYTFRPCFRGCGFCKVGTMKHPDTRHHSIWEFHDTTFKKICLLNNNTFMDKQWGDTFEEIWDEDLTIIDENGYDLRLIDEEKADALKRTKFQGRIHYAWDRMQDEKKILEGLKIAPKGTVYVLIGYDTTQEEDIYRCQKIVDYGFDPYIMPFNQTEEEKRFKRFIDTFMWRKYKTIKKAWMSYKS